jgi:serine/threonine protein kinase
MGEIYRARDTRLDRTVAIKVLPAELAQTPERRARIGRNVGLVSEIEERLDGLKVILPQEPMIVGALGATLFALDRAKEPAGSARRA